MLMIDKQSAVISCIVICGSALLARFTVSLHPYSGADGSSGKHDNLNSPSPASFAGFGVAPHYGDYEAQRHWMEITVHLPASEW